MRRPYVVYWNNIPAPYMVERFNALARLGGIEFEAWFNARTEADRSWQVDERRWNFRHRYLPSISVAGTTLRLPAPLFGPKPDLLVSLYAEPVFLAGWALAKLRGCKTAFRVLATHDSWVRRHPVKELARRLLFRAADAIETPGPDGRAFAIRSGAAPDKIFIATHTVDVPHFRDGSDAARIEDRTALRAHLGLKGCVFLYVGRLWSGKGLEHLVEAFQRVQRSGAGAVSLLIVGDGPAQAALLQVCRVCRLENVVFAGFRHKEELPRLHAAADVFVFPTLGDPYGLVVDEAMASALPIISTSAAGEIHERVKEDLNGFIVPPADPAALARRMTALARDAGLRERMGKSSRLLVAGHTPAAWATDFERLVHAVLSVHERRPGFS